MPHLNSIARGWDSNGTRKHGIRDVEAAEVVTVCNRIEPGPHGDESQTCRRHGHNRDHDDFLWRVNRKLVSLRRQLFNLLGCQSEQTRVVPWEVLSIDELYGDEYN